MTIVSSTQDCKTLLETSGIKNWKRTSKSKFLGYNVRTFSSGTNGLAVVVTDGGNNLLAHSIQQYEPVYSNWEAIRNGDDGDAADDAMIDVVAKNFSFCVGEYPPLVPGTSGVLVMITPTEYWFKEGYMFDQHCNTEHDDNCLPPEIELIDDMECSHSALAGVTKARAFLAMIEHGFYWEPRLQEFANDDDA